MNKALWVVQVVLAALFVLAGVMKLVMPIDQLVQDGGMPGWFIRFIGIAELLGGVGLILPALLRIQPWLTPLAAAGLVIIMIGAVVMGIPMGLVPTLLPLVTGVLAAFVAYGRWRAAPIVPKGSSMTVHPAGRR